MSGCNSSQGYLGKLALDLGADTAVDWDTADLMEIQRETVRKQGSLINTAGLRGTRARESDRTVDGPYTIGGSIVLNPSPRDLAVILPMAGFQLNTGTYELTESLALFGVLVDRVVDVYEYQNCYCQRLTIRGSEGQILELELEVVGDDEIKGTPAVFPSIAMPTGLATNPLMFFQSTLTLDSVARPINSFELSIQHVLEVKYRNSKQPQSICPSDRIITLKTNNPYTSAEDDLYPLLGSEISGSLAFTNATVGATINLPALRTPDKTPTIPGRSEIPLELELQAFRDGTTLEMTATVDTTA